MQEELPEYGRFKPKGDSPREPREPFIPDEMPGPPLPETPSLEGLHPPKGELKKEGLASFLTELEPLISSIQGLSRADQHKLAELLSHVKNQIHASDLSSEVAKGFEKVVEFFNELLIHSRPVDQEAALNALRAVRAML